MGDEVKGTPADRIQRYLDMRDAKPISQIGDSIHCVQAGSEFEAELLLPDVRALKAEHADLVEALQIARRYVETSIHLEADMEKIDAALSKAGIAV